MTNNGHDGGNSPDTLIVPAILVPDGDPEPHEWLAQHPDAIRVRATLVPQQLPHAETATQRPSRCSQADALGSDGGPHPGADEDRSEPDRVSRAGGPLPGSSLAGNPGSWAGTPGSGYDEGGPVAAYLRLREALAGVGQGHTSVRREWTQLAATERVPDTEAQSMVEKDNANGGSAGDAAKIHGLQDEIRDGANRAMPGRRAAFPAGGLVKPPFERPQGDENRDQPIKPDGDLRAPSKPPGVK